MNYDATDADYQAMRVIELLIESGHYKGFQKEDVVKAIGRDANSLAAAFTLKPAEIAEPREAVESAVSPESNATLDSLFAGGWPKLPNGENA
jgi:hypothetical protein